MNQQLKRREELEKMLDACPESVDYTTEEDGVLTNKITPLDTYRLVRAIGRYQKVQGKFLLYLDDRITEQNGYHTVITELQEDVSKICTERIESCPVLPIVKEIEGKVEIHLRINRDEKLLAENEASLMEKWKQEGKTEEKDRFERVAKIITLVLGSVTVATGTITWFLGLWPVQ